MATRRLYLEGENVMANRTSKRAVLVKAHEPIEVWERPIGPPQAGEALLRVEFAGVCGTDVHLWRGEVPLPGPVVLGHEGVATVEELGAGITTDYAGEPIKRGDRVYWVPLRPCYRCYGCTVEKDFTHCDDALSALFRDAGEPPSACYAELAWLPAGMAFYRIPDDTPSEAVIAFGCAMPTMLKGLERLGGIAVNQTVAVQGCGPVGLAATLLARASGAGEVIVLGAPARRLEMARRLGATATIDLEQVKSPEERVRRVREWTGGRGAEVVIEATGAVPAFGEGIQLAAKGGRYLIVGLWSAPGTVQVEPRYLNNMNLRIIGTALFEARHVHGAIQVARRHHRDLPMAEAVTHRFALAESQKALEAVAALQSVKAVIQPAA
jgi:threonine dehydrogenase-like Zn-dependent dehydrogenase